MLLISINFLLDCKLHKDRDLTRHGEFRGSERYSNLPKITQLVRGRGEIEFSQSSLGVLIIYYYCCNCCEIYGIFPLSFFFFHFGLCHMACGMSGLRPEI